MLKFVVTADFKIHPRGRQIIINIKIINTDTVVVVFLILLAKTISIQVIEDITKVIEMMQETTIQERNISMPKSPLTMMIEMSIISNTRLECSTTQHSGEIPLNGLRCRIQGPQIGNL